MAAWATVKVLSFLVIIRLQAVAKPCTIKEDAKPRRKQTWIYNLGP